MKILIIDCETDSSNPVVEWLKPHECYLMTTGASLKNVSYHDKNNYVGIISLDTENNDNLIYYNAEKLHQVVQFDRVIGVREFDLLPSPENFVFHAEVFEDRHGDLKLCEIAARAGGGPVIPAIETVYGVNLKEIAFRSLPGQPQVLTRLPRQSGRLSGWLMYRTAIPTREWKISLPTVLFWTSSVIKCFIQTARRLPIAIRFWRKLLLTASPRATSRQRSHRLWHGLMKRYNGTVKGANRPSFS